MSYVEYGKLKRDKLIEDVEMMVTVNTSKGAPFSTHMGITRNLYLLINELTSEDLSTKRQKHRRISMLLHGFAAKATRKIYPDKKFMITNPVRMMRKIMEGATSENHIFKGNQFLLAKLRGQLKDPEKHIDTKMVNYISRALKRSKKLLNESIITLGEVKKQIAETKEKISITPSPELIEYLEALIEEESYYEEDIAKDKLSIQRREKELELSKKGNVKERQEKLKELESFGYTPLYYDGSREEISLEDPKTREVFYESSRKNNPELGWFFGHAHIGNHLPFVVIDLEHLANLFPD